MIQSAISVIASVCSGSQIYDASTNTCYDTSLPTVSASSSELQTILQILFGILGALAVLFIVIGGFSYVVSGGDPQATGKAKSTIMYAVVGLIIAVFAEAIVTFVIGHL